MSVSYMSKHLDRTTVLSSGLSGLLSWKYSTAFWILAIQARYSLSLPVGLKQNHTSKNHYAWLVLHLSQHPLRRWDVSPFSDDPVRVLGYMVVADDMVHAGQRLVNIVLQPLQVLCLFVHWDDGVLQLHQPTFKRWQDGHLSSNRTHQTVNYKTQHVKSLFKSLSPI